MVSAPVALRRTAAWRLVAVLLAALAGAAWGAPAQPEAATGTLPRPAVFARHAMAVTANRYATQAAVAILGQGGTAVDAAIAAQFVLSLVEPQSSGIGGGGFLLAWDARRGRLRAYDGRETAPAAARSDRFLAAGAEPLRFHEAAVSGRSVGVPGLVAMLGEAHRRHGRLAWMRLAEPAIRLAEEGFEMSPRLHALLDRDPFLRAEAGARRLYYGEDGSPRPVGSRVANPEFAAVLRLLAQGGSRAFYEGDLAEDIVAAANGNARAAGDLTLADLRGYRSIEREPVCRAYRGYRVCGMPPPSSGGVTVLQILGLVERFALAGRAPLAPQTVHLFAEAGRLAYADRARYLADPDYVAVPRRRLLDPAYLEARARLIRPNRSLGRAAPGTLAVAPVHLDDGVAAELPATTHLSIVDAQGNAVALTSSIEDAFGSRILVRGFLLNNQLTDFAFRPWQDGRLAANRVEAGKRPLSSMAPTLVFDRRGQLVAVLGSPGGSRIVNYVARTLVALLDWRLPPDAALALPHYGSRNGPLELERGTPAEALAAPLTALGHDVEAADMTSGLHVIVRGAVGWWGAADPRREGSAAGLAFAPRRIDASGLPKACRERGQQAVGRFATSRFDRPTKAPQVARR